MESRGRRDGIREKVTDLHEMSSHIPIHLSTKTSPEHQLPPKFPLRDQCLGSSSCKSVRSSSSDIPNSQVQMTCTWGLGSTSEL